MSFLWLMTLLGVGVMSFVFGYGIYTLYRIKKSQKQHEESFERIIREQDTLSSLPQVDNPMDPNLLMGQLDIVEDYKAPKIQIGNYHWYKTTPINALIERNDLPPTNSSDERIYKTAEIKSDLRKQMGSLSLNDGRYCPIDHIVTQDQTARACPVCGRGLLWFGWD